MSSSSIEEGQQKNKYKPLSGNAGEPQTKCCKKRWIALAACCCLLLIGIGTVVLLFFLPTKPPDNDPIDFDTPPERLLVTYLFVTPIRNGSKITECGTLQVSLMIANSSVTSPTKTGCDVGFFLSSDLASQATLGIPSERENASLWLHVTSSLFPNASETVIAEVRDLEFQVGRNFSTVIGDPDSVAQYLINFTVFYDIGIPLPSSYTSYYPHRGVSARWYIDGHDYMEDAYYALSNATSHIYITDWWIEPYIYLIRYPPQLKYRLDMLLARKAAEGVQIRVLLYSEVASSLPRTQSAASQIWLEAIHPNIKVVRHAATDLLDLRWSHHQKTLIIDNMIAFVGGLDLTYGRWDYSYHPVTDPLSMSNLFPGPDFQVPEMQVDNDVQPYFRDLTERSRNLREPWHDTQIGVEGWAAVDVAKNFVERWNTNSAGTGYAPLPEPSFIQNYTGGFLFSTMRGNSTDATSNLMPNSSFYNLSDLNYDPRAIPSHDAMNAAGRTDVSELPPSPAFTSLSAPGALRCQVLRSIGKWSANVQTEQSIQAMMISMISNAERFIYIENQFFISSLATATRTVLVHNIIGEAIIARISRAIRRGEKFRVIIITPVHPEGELKAPETTGVLYLQMYTLFRGKTSILGILNNSFPNIDLNEYIHFAALRNYGFVLNQTLQMNDLLAVSHQVYVHSKTMIVDDRHILIGSANINDRSLVGDRDSELDIHCESEPDLSPEDAMLVPMGGEPYRVSKFVHAARLTALNEHMGLMRNDSFMVDLLNGTVYGAWRERAAANAAIYQEVFPGSVSNNQTTWPIYDQHQTLMPQNVEKLAQIRGLVVEYPQLFLSGEPNFWPTSLSGCPTQTSLTEACGEILS